MPLNEYSYINRPEEEPVQVPERTSLADIPRNRTLLELATGIETSEDLPTMSDNWLIRDWVLPAITGASAKTEDYQPGLLDMALAVPAFGVVGKAGKAAYSSVKNLLRNRNALLRAADAVGSSPVPPLETWDDVLRLGERARNRAAAEAAEEIPTGYQRGDYARQAAVPTRSADEVATDIVREYGTAADVTWNDAQSIVSDIGEEGWLRFQDEITSLPLDQRNLHFENFIAKYKVTGQLTGGDAAAAYKASRFTSRMPDQSMTIDKGRHGKLLFESSSERKGQSRISMKWSHPTNEWAKAELDFNIHSKIDDAGNAFEEISGISFFASEESKIYAGRLMSELLDKIPDNAVINESSMTYDALYTLLRRSIRKNAKIVFHKRNPKWPSGSRRKQSSAASRLSPWSMKFNEARELYRETGDPKHIDKAVDEIMDEMRGMINEYAKKNPERVVGKPQPKAIKEVGGDYLSYGPDPSEFYDRGRFEYNFISIHKMAGIIAGAFGYKNKEEFMKFLSYDPESVEAQIFDNDFSL